MGIHFNTQNIFRSCGVTVETIPGFEKAGWLAGPKANLAARFPKYWLGLQPGHPCWLDDQARWMAAKFLIGW